jgi:hypothetical protein
MEATLQDGKVELPASLLKADDLRSGAKFSVERLGAGDYRIKQVPQKLKSVRIEESPGGYLVFNGGGRITTKMVRDLEARLA